VLQQMTSGRPNQRVRRRRETKNLKSENMLHKSGVESFVLCISQLPFHKRKW